MLGRFYEWCHGWSYGWSYWLVSRLVVMLLWSKYYCKRLCRVGNGGSKTIKLNDNDDSTKFYSEVSRVRLFINGNENKEWEKNEGGRIMSTLKEKGNIDWDTVLHDTHYDIDDIDNIDDIVLIVGFIIKGEEYGIMFSWKDRWEYPIIFPPYGSEELEQIWENTDYRHSLLVAEVKGEEKEIDITSKINTFLGPKGDMFKGHTCAYKAKWLAMLFGCQDEDCRLNIIDNEGNDYVFGMEEVVVMREI